MANESKTVGIVRSHFEQYSQTIKIEEQASDSVKIDKLLKNASKKRIWKRKTRFYNHF